MAQGTLLITEDRCKGCGLCVTVCPPGALRMAEERFNEKGYHPVELAEPEACIGCAQCAVICPDVVFTVYRRRRQTCAAAA